MKKGIAVVLALIMTGISMKIPGDVSKAVQMEETTEAEIETEREEEIPKDEREKVSGTSFRTISSDVVTGPGAGIIDEKEANIVSLMIPQKVEVVIDPWGMDGNGQIYSKQYTIRNVGETIGMLTLSNVISSFSAQSGVEIRGDSGGIHEGQEKSIYMKMVFENGDEVAFSEQGSEYKIKLVPGEEIGFWFSGEVNENTSQPWIDGDVEVKTNYFWEEEVINDTDTFEEESLIWNSIAGSKGE